MEKNKRRSSLRQPPARDDDQAAAAGTQNCVLKRRISFSGKKSVREFVNTEEPHYWEDSYELSDCTNGEDNSREKAPKAGPSQQAPTADKENIPLQFEHPSTRIDMTLNLRTSIDVPRSVPRESLFAESLSLSSMGRDKLKDTLYSYPITDKTIDLMQISSKVREDCSELSSFEMEHMKTQPTKSVGDSFMDITPLGYTGPDSDARDRLPSHGFFQTEPNNSTINYLGDESVLIPFDMISGENISKNLNFRQLNDDLEAGKIKVFANGPRTPCTDRKVKQMFWHGLDEDQDQDQDPMDINIRSIKPRATLNFSENMTMSPLAQTAPVAAVAEPLPREKLKIPDDKRKYRVSQADEMMLDNTNFLAHAKLGDETQSRNSSKVLSRRESTYESSEIDLGTPKRNSSCRQDFQPSTMQEAPSKHSKPRQTIHLPVEMEQDVFQLEEAAAAIPPGRASASARRTISLNESMDQENIVDEKATVIQSEDNVPRKHTISKRRETLLMEESMEEDIISPLKELHLKGNAHPAKGPKSRHTLHLAEPLEEDEVHPRNAAATEAISKDRRHLAEAVQEHLQMGNQRSKARQTILQEEPIEEDVDNAATGAIRNEAVQQNLPMGNQRSKARQTILQAEPIEEDVTATGAIQNKSFQPNLQIGNQRSKARQTILQSEAIVEDVDDAATGAIRKDYEHLAEAGQKHLPMGYQRSKARQTILQSEPIEEDVDDAATGAIRKEALQQNLPMGNQRPKARQTILQAAAIEEEFDYAATGAMRKDRKQLAESVQEHLPMANQRSKASQSILQSEAIEEDVDEDTGAIRKDYEHLAEAGQKHLPMGYQRSKARQTILQSEPIEEDVDDAATGAIRKEALQQNLPMGNQRPKARQTILQAAAIEEEFDYAATGAMRKDRKQLAESVQEHLPMANQRSKASQSILQSEAIEEDVDEDTGAIRKDYEHLAEAGQKHLPMGYQRSKARQTILQSEPIEEGDDDAATGAIRKEALQQNLPMGNQRPKARQTILQAAAIEEEFDYAATGAMRKDRKQLAESVQEHLPMANQRSKASQSILQSEAIEEDVDEDTGAIRKDYEHLAEAGQKHLPMGYQRSKARQTILQSEPIEEGDDDAATGAIRKEALQQNLPMGNQRPKARQTILQAEAIEEEFDYAATGAMRKDYEHLAEAGQKHLPMGYQRSKARQTILQSEPIEEGDDDAATGAIRKEALQQNLPMGNQRPKARQTILQAAAIEEEFDYAATGAMRKDRKQLAESVQEHLPMANQRSKASQSILQSEAIEEDVDEDTGAIRKDYEHLAEAGQKHLPMGYQRSKARQTILQSEPIEKDVDDEATGAIRKEALQQNLPMGNQRPKARQTILQAAAIEEEFDYAATGAMRKDYEHLVEAVQEHHVPTGDRSSRSRQTLLTAVPIEEDHSIAYQSFKPRNTHESREESVAFKSKNTLMLAELIENMTAFRTSKARQTLLLATSMEEEEQLREPPLEKSTKVAPNRGSRAEQTLIMSESMEEEAEKADDFQSPLQSTGAPPELLPITPMLKQNRSGSLNSMKEFEQFEKDTNQAATPRSPLRKISALLRKFSSMGESMKMSLEGDASECGTPIRHSGDAKRLFAHLTPNLPEAKKRNTHLFGDMEMEQEMEASIAIKEVTAAVDMNFDLTLQPVRGLIGEHMSRPTVFEERPITVSDVSAYFQNQSGKVKKEPAEGTIEVEHGEKRDTCPRDSGSSTDRSFKSYAPTNKRFINLSGDTTIFSAAIVETIDVDQPENNQIDNVRLSLVSTLADEPDTDEEAPVEDAVALPKQPEPQPQPEPEPEPCQEQQESSRVVAAGSSASCRRCANCRRSLSEPRLSNDSFVLPTQPQWDLTREIEMLRRVRAKPNLDDVHKYWQMKEQERRTIALEKELDSSSEASEEEEFSEWDVNEVMATYKGEMERFKRNLADNQEVLQQMLVALEPVETFFDRLHDLLGEQQPNWIFDYQLKVSRKLIFTHRLLTTFRLIVDYETVDDLETAIRVCDINVEQATVILPLQSWTAFEHLLDFQLQLKLPVNLTDSIEGSSVEAFAQFLQRINAICVDILRTFHKLLTVLTATRTSLLRQVNRIVVKKTVRRHIEVDTRTRMEKTDFVIEIGNVEAISFRDILQPKLHFFNENIQFLPTGVAFLEAFLDHPEQYLKV
ncbi:uncharacterized protein LOC108161291 isoform X2 [Drosophila miranda]|uniref:uncharacterized protein LOC108161291 isoform X2 n=1 Tax=Drosophila miranda TaxID=7229 RepID=UPI00143F933C|nr:uncharacterized protein LOC108161291 isoform X2 [Drosophila miranda]